MDDFLEKLLQNPYYKEALSRISDKKEREDVEKKTIEVYMQLLEALLPGLNKTLQNEENKTTT